MTSPAINSGSDLWQNSDSSAARVTRTDDRHAGPLEAACRRSGPAQNQFDQESESLARTRTAAQAQSAAVCSQIVARGALGRGTAHIGQHYAETCKQYLLAVLDLSRPSHSSSPLLASAPSSSPVLMPPPPTPLTPRRRTKDPASSPAAVSVAALDCLLAVLVDSPKNVRTFEQIDGLATIVKVLKDKTVAQSVRIKVIEVLYFYLLPEADDLPSMAALSDFVPQTPVKSRHRSTVDKRELLARVMPNVGALEERFRAMGLSR
ncbi:hypothetical protein OIO90_002664 [Microbotryomycetes sp. JL221]|nr:hypothetical protein OIO90_002664 [Microbotryomycetes sp. JL221]